MKMQFKEIRVFCGNEWVGHNSFYAEFVYDNQPIKNMLLKFNGSIRYSRNKSNELVFEPQTAKEFIKALRKTKFSSNVGATIYDEACLLAQDFSSNSSGTLYIQYTDRNLSINELINVISQKFFKEEDADKISQFKKDCIDAIQSESYEFRELNN